MPLVKIVAEFNLPADPEDNTILTHVEVSSTASGRHVTLSDLSLRSQDQHQPRIQEKMNNALILALNEIQRASRSRNASKPNTNKG